MTLTSENTPDQLIARFDAIPDELWITNEYTDPQDETRHDALGHLGETWTKDTPEATALRRTLRVHGLLASEINDGRDPRFPQPTPKQRIIAALHEVKRLESLLESVIE